MVLFLQQGQDFDMHIRRLVVALILLPLFYFYIMKLSQGYFFIFLLLVSVIAQSEFYSMYRIRGLMRNSGIFAGIAILLTIYLSRDLLPDMLLLSFIAISCIRLIGRRAPESSLNDVSHAVLALLYIPSLLGFQIFLRQEGAGWILFLYGCVWASDSLAYYIGKSIGRRKLYREVSPNKTVAGAFGSLVGGALSGWVLDAWLIHAMGLWKSILLGIIIGAVSIIGDLVESMFKRDAGVKDSSSLIPGHGGILDKFDGALFAGPVLYWISVTLGVIK